MTEDEYKAFVAHAKSGTLLIGIDRAFARRFYTDVPLTRIKEETGEAPYFEKIVVWFAFISAPIALLASFILSVLAFRWWAVLAIPLSAIVYFGFAGDSSRGQTRMLGVSIVLALAIASLFTNFFSSQSVPWYATAVAFAFWAQRLVYCGATTLLRAFILRNQRALEFTREHIAVKETTGADAEGTLSEDTGRRT